METTRAGLVRRAIWLAVFTVAWNLAEGVIAIVAAAAAGSDALLGFGLDSGVESLSGSILLWRLLIEQRDPARAEAVERRAVRLIAWTFFVLAAFIAVESIRTLIDGEHPDSSIVGIVLTAVSLIVMPVLASQKRKVGRAMGSQAVTADSAQTWACVYLSATVLAGLVANAVGGWWWADPLAALLVVGFLVKEGREAWQGEGLDDCC